MNILLTILLMSNSAWSDVSQTEEYGKIQKCVKQIHKICEGDQDKDCPKKKWSQLPANCKEYSDAALYMNPDNITTGNIPGPMGDCFRQIHKLCQFDNELALKNLEKAGKKYQTCVEKSVSKLTGECKKLLGTQ